MKTVTASELKNRVAKILRDVSRTGEPVIVTRRGRPIAQLQRVQDKQPRKRLGAMQGTAIIVGDIVSPVFDEWSDVTPKQMRVRRKR